jgi:putative ABC transport system permease protein
MNLGDELIRDLVFAVRLLKKSPGFTATAVLSLVLGIGANVAIFSLVDILLLRALPVGEPRRLLEVSRAGGGTLSYPMYEHVKTGNDVFSGVLAVVSGRMAAGIRIGGIDAGDAHFSAVSGDYFDVLRVRPTIGRTLTDADLGPSDRAVISHDLWQRALGGDPSVLGKGLRLGRGTYTVVGVAQEGFRGIVTGYPVDVWVPVTWVGPLTNPEALMFRVIGRMKSHWARSHPTSWPRSWADRCFQPPWASSLALPRR